MSLLSKIKGFISKKGISVSWTFDWPGQKKQIEQSKRIYDQAMKEKEENENERREKNKDKLHI